MKLQELHRNVDLQWDKLIHLCFIYVRFVYIMDRNNTIDNASRTYGSRHKKDSDSKQLLAYLCFSMLKT